MRILKAICALTVLTSLLLSVAPAGVCQMALGKSVACDMPCCPPSGPSPSCPMIRPEAPRDMIGTSSVKLSPTLQVVATLSVRGFLTPFNQASEVYRQPQIPKLTFCSTPQSIPAPPTLA